LSAAVMTEAQFLDEGHCVYDRHEGDRVVEECCPDGFCRACHISLSFEACVGDHVARTAYAKEHGSSLGGPSVLDLEGRP
jgi:hypothetical protein